MDQRGKEALCRDSLLSEAGRNWLAQIGRCAMKSTPDCRENWYMLFAERRNHAGNCSVIVNAAVRAKPACVCVLGGMPRAPRHLLGQNWPSGYPRQAPEGKTHLTIN